MDNTKFRGIFAEKMWVNAKATHILFSKKNSIYAIFNGQRFNDTLVNVSLNIWSLNMAYMLFFFAEKKCE